MRTLKIGATTFILENVEKLSKEEFLKDHVQPGMDGERTWARLQREIKTPVENTHEDKTPINTKDGSTQKGSKGSGKSAKDK